MTITRQLIVFPLLLIAILLLFENNSADLWVQNHFYTPATASQPAHWIFDKTDHGTELWFHKAPKILIICLGVLSLAGFGFSFYAPQLRSYRKRLLFFALCIAFVPMLVGGAKQITNTYCPDQTTLYGGEYPYVKVLEPYPDGFIQHKKGRCFPAGHATVGFALMALYFMFSYPPYRRMGLLTGISAGWLMGLYQMLKGVHFLSHTIISMLAGWIVILLVYQAIYYATGRKPLID